MTLKYRDCVRKTKNHFQLTLSSTCLLFNSVLQATSWGRTAVERGENARLLAKERKFRSLLSLRVQLGKRHHMLPLCGREGLV